MQPFKPFIIVLAALLGVTSAVVLQGVSQWALVSGANNDLIIPFLPRHYRL